VTYNLNLANNRAREPTVRLGRGGERQPTRALIHHVEVLAMAAESSNQRKSPDRVCARAGSRDERRQNGNLGEFRVDP
jgi:hypothetical protein